ncbi:MAG: hypothetical protein PHY47_23120 [Lachnospiraceae bacterium]|nr:hypothetical protein [Lachnospiraceae bacterium]
MGSNEDYLDNLLRSIDERENNENMSEDISIDEYDDDPIAIEDIGEPEEENDETPILDIDRDPNKMMSTEDIAKLLEAIPELDEEETESSSSVENIENDDMIMAADIDDESDVTDLLDLLPEDDELSEISDLLKKNDNNEMVEKDVLSMLENADADMEERSADADEPIDLFSFGDENQESINNEEPLEEESLKKTKHKKKEKKEKKKENSNDQEQEDSQEIDQTIKKEKKPGFLQKLFHKAPKTIEEEVQENPLEDEILNPIMGPSDLDGNPSPENLAILQELDQQEPEGKKTKKVKKEKEKKESKSKEKKKKEPRNKKEKVKKEPEAPENKIPKKKIIHVFIIVSSMFIFFIICLAILPKYTYVNEARDFFGLGDYQSAYEKLCGFDLNEDEQILYNKSVILMKMQRSKQSYSHWKEAGQDLEALNELVMGIKIYDKYIDYAKEYGIEDKFNEYYDQLRSCFVDYEITEEQLREFAVIKDTDDYSIALEDFLYGPTVVELPEGDQSLSDNSISKNEIAETTQEPMISDQTVSSNEMVSTKEQSTMNEVSDNEASSVVESAVSSNTTDNQEANQTQEDKLLYEFDVKKGSDGNYRAGE